MGKWFSYLVNNLASNGIQDITMILLIKKDVMTIVTIFLLVEWVGNHSIPFSKSQVPYVEVVWIFCPIGTVPQSHMLNKYGL